MSDQVTNQESVNSHPASVTAPGRKAVGFDIGPDVIKYAGHVTDWIAIYRAMAQVDSDLIQADLERAIFNIWREGVRAAVISALGQAWVGERELTSLHTDLKEYMVT